MVRIDILCILSYSANSPHLPVQKMFTSECVYSLHILSSVLVLEFTLFAGFLPAVPQSGKWKLLEQSPNKMAPCVVETLTK